MAKKQLYGPPNPYANFYGPVNPGSNPRNPKTYAPAPRRSSPYRAKAPAKKPTVARVAPSLALDIPVEEISPLSLAMPDPLAITPQLQGRRFIDTPSRAGARPGDTKVNQLDLSQGMSTGKSRNSYMSGPEYDILAQAAMSTEPNRALQAGIDEQQGMYEDVLRNMPTGMVDLTPLMAMTDAMTGSKFAQSYKAPGDMYDNVKLLSGLQDRTQSSKERLAQLIMNETGGLKQGQDEQGYKSGIEESQKAGFAVPQPHAPRLGQSGLTPSGVANAEKWIIGENQKMLKDFSSDKSSLDNLNRALAGGNLEDVRRALAQAARVISGEKGVLTEGDLTRVLPKTLGMDMAQFQAYVTSDPAVTLDPYMLDGLKRAVASSELDLRRRYAEKHQAFNSQLEGSSAFGGIPSLPVLQSPNNRIFAPPPPQKPDSSFEDMMNKVREDIKKERASGRK